MLQNFQNDFNTSIKAELEGNRDLVVFAPVGSGKGVLLKSALGAQKHQWCSLLEDSTLPKFNQQTVVIEHSEMDLHTVLKTIHEHANEHRFILLSSHAQDLAEFPVIEVPSISHSQQLDYLSPHLEHQNTHLSTWLPHWTDGQWASLSQLQRAFKTIGADHTLKEMLNNPRWFQTSGHWFESAAKRFEYGFSKLEGDAKKLLFLLAAARAQLSLPFLLRTELFTQSAPCLKALRDLSDFGFVLTQKNVQTNSEAQYFQLSESLRAWLHTDSQRSEEIVSVLESHVGPATAQSLEHHYNKYNNTEPQKLIDWIGRNAMLLSDILISSDIASRESIVRTLASLPQHWSVLSTLFEPDRLPVDSEDTLNARIQLTRADFLAHSDQKTEAEMLLAQVEREDLSVSMQHRWKAAAGKAAQGRKPEQAKQYFEDIIQSGDDVEPKVLAYALSELGDLYSELGDNALARQCGFRALQVARDTDNLLLQAETELQISKLLLTLSENDGSRAAFERAKALCRRGQFTELDHEIRALDAKLKLVDQKGKAACVELESLISSSAPIDLRIEALQLLIIAKKNVAIEEKIKTLDLPTRNLGKIRLVEATTLWLAQQKSESAAALAGIQGAQVNLSKNEREFLKFLKDQVYADSKEHQGVKGLDPSLLGSIAITGPFWLKHSLSEVSQSPSPAQTLKKLSLKIEEGARWFQLGDDPKVDLSRHRNTRTVLLILAKKKQEGSRRSIPKETLFALGWPEQSISPKSANLRLRVVIHSLRSKGLGNYLETIDGGYRLSNSLKVEFTEDAVEH